ncbi:siderophore ABC transporter substrate-binding protein (plasmid) [Agrobacterium tumefaciens]|uniref:siderophore ABC transporter substrate-binding protein n=1 Tax=Agrobacterium tumefaciens TaxID=358 RepID=UPI0021D3AB73|nr:siderophore ABC transporter substrate-binding protein [Agrobacterium tumefaciens]NTZ63483.1 siderophore ABC transporter substrate-binding protein [Agrobacterium tumefaciens]UXT00183.1 siderophore ABC transporter substrate-binding protein [Agrobacterium tumefaciens]UXT52883.1 siderophore ABC transporter substrate-binding protein [Agrobacterium tumefaciens]UXT68944.1 siderophore ABC transporter substrate-binding protein [Agrobacterium tumefaciens]
MKRSGNLLRFVAAITGLFLSAIALASTAQADVTIQHTKGEISLSAVPKKVFVFDLASLDTLTALGVEVAGVPGGRKPAYLSQYEASDVAKIGTLFEPDYEAINAEKPDLIIVAGRSSAKYADLSKIAPTIDLTTDSKHFIDSSKKNIRTLATIFGKQGEAETLLKKFDASTAALKEKAAHAGKGMLILTTGGKMSTFGVGSRFGSLFSDYGVKVADENIKVGMHGQPTSFEYILETNPDWIFVIDRDAAIGREGDAASKLLDNEIVVQTTAWKANQVVYLDAAAWYLVGGGLTSMQSTVNQLTEAFDKT